MPSCIALGCLKVNEVCGRWVGATTANQLKLFYVDDELVCDNRNHQEYKFSRLGFVGHCIDFRFGICLPE